METMQSRALDSALAKLSHRELLRTLAEHPSYCPLVREFIARYDPRIRQNIVHAMQRRMVTATPAALKPLIDDAVNETYYRLFRSNCRALRQFRCHYENAIFAYLRSICRNTVSLLMRRKSWNPVDFSLWSIEELIEREKCRSKHKLRAISPAAYATMAEENEECKQLEQIIRTGFLNAFCARHVNRNFIIFKLHFLYGYHLHEIAHIKALGLSVSGVTNTAVRIRRWLRREFKSAFSNQSVRARGVR
jgi:RNA polymerase sigma factor (sigma-70 family)